MKLLPLFRTAAVIGGLSLAFGAAAQTQTTTTTKQETTTQSSGMTTGTHKTMVHHKKTTVRPGSTGTVVRKKSTQTHTETTTSGQ